MIHVYNIKISSFAEPIVLRTLTLFYGNESTILKRWYSTLMEKYNYN